MLNYGNFTIGNSKSFTAVIVKQKVNPMTRGRINPATLFVWFTASSVRQIRIEIFLHRTVPKRPERKSEK
jgi:hypothetical protein